MALALWCAAVGAEQQQLLAVFVEGVEGPPRDNVLAFLEIRQQAGKPVTDKLVLSRLLQTTRLSELIPLTRLLEDATAEIERTTRRTVDTGPPVSYFQLEVDETRLRWLHDRAEDDIRRALEPFGYYHATVAASLERSGQGWVARYRIEKGPPVRITRAQLRIDGAGRHDPAFQEVLADSPLRKGEVLVQPSYEELKKRLELLATERGYFDARFTVHQILLNPAVNTADIELIYDTGERYRFGQVSWPETPLDPALLRRYQTFQPGDPYDSNRLLELQRALIDSGYFQQVEVAAPSDQAVNRATPVNINLEMRDRNRYAFGLGYGTDTGPRGSFRYERRWLNPWGHRFNTRLLASRIKSQWLNEYRIPGRDPTVDTLILRSNLDREYSDVIDSATAQAGVAWERKVGLWQSVVSLDYSVDTFDLTERQTSYLLIPGLSLTRVDADDPVNIDQGTRLDLQLRGAYEPLLSSASFLQALVGGRAVYRLNPRQRLIGRAVAGDTWTSDFAGLPPSLRFFAGGDNSVRGYGLNRIAPRENGQIAGGKRLLVGSLEYEYRLWSNWGVAAFVDSGDAFDDAPQFKTGVGLGLRWFTPVGPLRLDFAHGLESDDLIRIHLMFGPEL